MLAEPKEIKTARTVEVDNYRLNVWFHTYNHSLSSRKNICLVKNKKRTKTPFSVWAVAVITNKKHRDIKNLTRCLMGHRHQWLIDETLDTQHGSGTSASAAVQTAMSLRAKIQ